MLRLTRLRVGLLSTSAMSLAGGIAPTLIIDFTGPSPVIWAED